MTRGLKPGIVAAFAAIYLIWGSTYLAIKISITTIPPFTMTAVRALTAGAILYVWGRWRGAPAPTPGQWMTGAAVGALLFLGGHGGLGWAEQRVPSGAASLVVATLPLWMTLLEAIWERDPVLTASGWAVRRRRAAFNARTVCGLTAGMGGILLLLGPGSVLGGEAVDALGGAVLVLCSLSWAVGSALARRTGQPSSLTVTMGTYLLTGGALLFGAGQIGGELRGFDPGSVSVSSIGALAFLIVFGTVVAFSAYTWLLRHTSLAAVSTYAFVNPVVAVFLGWSWGGEALNLRVLASAALVVGAVGLILKGAENPSARQTQEVHHDRTNLAWPDEVAGSRRVRGLRERDGSSGTAEHPWKPGLPGPPTRPRRRDGDPRRLPVGVVGGGAGLRG